MSADPIDNEPAPILRLDDFLKCRGMVFTGGEAKVRIQAGEVCLNGEVETRRRKQITIGDVVDIGGETLIVNQTDFFDFDG
ncbi:ribosome-associated protein [Novipirellula aureliae]|uniref:Ribosome-associated protein n=1 Tax=Novipirellula aureliae TaxID=2527966 RepID=A0A5C6EEC1_9BACT|nr:RNA-binding S4 domain-containing protein [Novipirellula aureliae]TWU45569.1 ribosome-associated protein [Novipirellula aureliae]